MQNTYLIDGKRIAAQNLAQAMFAEKNLSGAKAKPLTLEEVAKARRTQFHAK